MKDEGTKLREAMGHKLDGLQAATPIEQIRQQVQRHRRFRGASLVALVALVAASGTLVIERFMEDEVDRVASPTQSADDELGAPDVARLVCDQDGMTALDPEVAARPDGVYLEVLNQTTRREFYISKPDGRDNEGGGLSPMGITKITTSMPPGEIYVSCFGKGEDISHQQRLEGRAVITVVDPDRLWVPPELDCSIDDRDRIVDDSVPEGAETDVDGLIRAIVPGIQQEDQIRKAGYPLTQSGVQPRIIIRDGLRLATVMLEPEDEGYETWVAFVNACHESGIGT